MVVLGAGAAVGGVIVAVGGLAGDPERVTQMWVGAELTNEGGTPIAEVIDYDFGLAFDKHGIFRDIPGLSVESPVTVQSDSAPAGIAARTPIFTTGAEGSQLKIGDPGTTITGRHRYRIDYSLPRGELLPGNDDTLSWDAVGTAWEVPIGRAEVHVVAPWEFDGGRCSTGAEGATRRLLAAAGRAGPPRRDRGRPRRRRRVSPSPRRGASRSARRRCCPPHQCRRPRTPERGWRSRRSPR